MEKKWIKHKEIWLSGSEIFCLMTKENKKILVREKDGNNIQRNYEPWEKERFAKYKKSLLENFPHNPIYVSEFQGKWYVVDGQHRLIAIKQIIDDEQQYNDSTITNKLFKFIVVSAKAKNPEKHIVEGFELFNILNTTSSTVSMGAVCKVKFKSVNEGKTTELQKSYESAFKYKVNKTTEEIKTDDIFEMIATALFSIETGSKKLYKINKMKEEILVFLDKKLKAALIDKMINLFEQFKANGIKGNKKNSDSAQPSKNILIPLLLTACEKDINHAALFKDKIDTLYSSREWKDSKKNTRAPQVLSMAATSIINSTAEEDLVDEFKKQDSSK